MAAALAERVPDCADKALAIKESLPQRALVFVICAVLNNQ